MNVTVDHTQNIVLTSDDIPTVAAVYSFPSYSSAIVQVRVIGFDNGQNTYVLEKEYGIKRSAGSCSIVDLGVTILNVSNAELQAASATLNVNGSSIEVVVIGIPGMAINWAVRIDLMYSN